MKSSNLSLKGKVSLVTGAGSGIGKAAAVRLASAGSNVGLLGRDKEELLATADEIKQHDGMTMILVADITDASSMRKAMAALDDRWGRLDVVFANAGVNGVWAPLEELEPEEWRETVDINLTGTFLTLKYAIPLLKRQGGSVIINASINGTRTFSNAGASAYSSSKAGQVALTKMAALELAKHHIRVNAVCPGWIETEIADNTEKRNIEAAEEPVEFPDGSIPLTNGKPGRPEQVADLVHFLASAAADHITGTEIWIDGGESLLEA